VPVSKQQYSQKHSATTSTQQKPPQNSFVPMPVVITLFIKQVSWLLLALFLLKI